MDNMNYGQAPQPEYGQAPQPGYGQAPQYYAQPVEEPVSILGWIGTTILCIIPIVNLIMLIVWAVSCKNTTKKNWAIASLIMAAIAFVLFLICGATIGAAFARFAMY